MLKRILVFLILIFPTYILLGQDEGSDEKQITDLIKSQLTAKDLGKLVALEKEEQNANDLLSEVDNSYEELSQLRQEIDNQKDKKIREKLLKKSVNIEKKAVRSHVEALKILSNVYVKNYELFRADLKKFSKDSNIITLVKELENKVYECFEEADLNVQKVFYTVNPNELFKIFTDAYKQERLGLFYQKKIYALFLDWDALTLKIIDEKIEAILLNKPGKKDQTEPLSELKDSVNIKTIVIYDTVKVEQAIEISIVYKIQIAASKNQLSNEVLGQIYPEVDMIQSETDDNWYKYSVGYFSYYQDAQNFKTRIGVPGAFVVAYKNGKKVPLGELTNHPSFIKK